MFRLLFTHHQGACDTEYHNLTTCAIVQHKIMCKYVNYVQTILLYVNNWN